MDGDIVYVSQTIHTDSSLTNLSLKNKNRVVLWAEFEDPMEPGKKEALVCATTFTYGYGEDTRVVTLLDGVEKLDDDFKDGC